MRENTDQNNSEYRHFLRSGCGAYLREALIYRPVLIRGNLVPRKPELFDGNLADFPLLLIAQKKPDVNEIREILKKTFQNARRIYKLLLEKDA